MKRIKYAKHLIPREQRDVRPYRSTIGGSFGRNIKTDLKINSMYWHNVSSSCRKFSLFYSVYISKLVKRRHLCLCIKDTLLSAGHRLTMTSGALRWMSAKLQH